MNFSNRPWLVVAGSTLALTVGNGPVMQFTFGVFLKPLTAAFGIDRGLGSLALTTGLLATALSLPFAGRLADRYGSRRSALCAVLAFASAVALAGLVSHSIWAFMALFALAGVAAAGQTPLPYMKAIASKFDKGRGLALSIGLTGVGIGAIVLPMVVQRLIDLVGWRGAYVGLAALLLIVAVPCLVLFIPGTIVGGESAQSREPALGLMPREAFRTRAFWFLVAGLFLAAGSANGTIAHVVPLLTDRGVPPAQAVSALAWVGAASIVGRICGGYLIDRFWAPLVSMVFFAGMICGIAILALTASPQLASLATILIGLGLGVEADLVAFLISRYLGTRAFGALFGYVFGSFILASSLGPILMGVVFDSMGSYTPCLTLFGILTAAAALLFLSLGRYTYPIASSVGDARH